MRSAQSRFNRVFWNLSNENSSRTSLDVAERMKKISSERDELNILEVEQLLYLARNQGGATNWTLVRKLQLVQRRMLVDAEVPEKDWPDDIRSL